MLAIAPKVDHHSAVPDLSEINFWNYLDELFIIIISVYFF